MFASAGTAEKAAAQSRGFAIDRFEPSERGSTWFALESLDLRGTKRPAAGLVLSYASKPLQLKAPDGSKTAIVSDVFAAHVGGDIVMWERVRFALNVPVVLHTGGDDGLLHGQVIHAPADSTQLGDIRVGVDARIAGKYEEPFTFAGGVQLWVPTGAPSSYTGDGGVRVGPRLMGAGIVGPIAYSARVGVVVRTPDQTKFADSSIGTELAYGFGGGYRFAEGKGVIGPEFYGSSAFGNFFKTRSSPMEVILGGHYFVVHNVQAGLGIGTGLVSGYGAPGVRVTGGVEWVMDAPAVEKAQPIVEQPKDENADTDGDGIPDRIDACMDVQGIKTDDPRTNGCADRDGDGIMDPLDHCPFQIGPYDPDPNKNGCPPPPPPPKEPDADNDGIPDRLDACPNASGKPNPDRAKNGCPKVLLSGKRIIVTVDLPADEEAMTQIAAIVTDDTSIKHIKIDAHTDNRGDPKDLQKQSQEKADSIAKWLIAHGVDKKRIIATGHGGDLPIESNDTDEGRAINRRVELSLEREE